METSQYIALEETYGAHNYHPLDVVLTRGKGVWVWDVTGRRYLDCLSAYSAVNQGHCHPRILETLVAQARRLTLTSRAFRNDQLGPFYEELCRATRSHKVLPMNSGAEAVETAIKTVRKWGYQTRRVPENMAEIIVCDGNFHGRTITIIGFSTEETSRRDFGPFTPGFRNIPFGNADALEAAITPHTVGFMVEPIQGEAGVILPPDDYLPRVREICNRHGILLILDEIQTGLGRTGAMLAEDHSHIEADLTLVGKALSGGFYPISAVLSGIEVMNVLKPGEHGSTFGGNPLACAVARTALKVIVEEGMIENARETGAYFLGSLQQIATPAVKEVRGRGLMIGMELYPDAGGARRLCEELMKEGLLCKETHEHTLRIAPPLIIDRETVDWAVDCIQAVLLKR